MSSDLVQAHHSTYLEDLPFWKSITAGKDPVLEVGCGHGRVTIPLLEAGRKVTGIDINGQSIHHLSGILDQRSPDLKENAQIVQGDILSFQTEKTYRSVIIPCNTYSTFPGSMRFNLLKKTHEWLADRGLFAFSVPHPDRLADIHAKLISGQEMDPELEAVILHPFTGNPVQVSSRFHTLENRLGWDWIYDHLLPDGNVERTVHSACHDLISPEMYEVELESAGYEIDRIQGDFQGGDFSSEAPYLILICRKL